MELNVELSQQDVNIIQIGFNEALDAIDVDIALPEWVQVYGPYGVEKLPEYAIGEWLGLHVIKNPRKDHVHTLDVTHLYVLYYVTLQDVL